MSSVSDEYSNLSNRKNDTEAQALKGLEINLLVLTLPVRAASIESYFFFLSVSLVLHQSDLGAVHDDEILNKGYPGHLTAAEEAQLAALRAIISDKCLDEIKYSGTNILIYSLTPIASLFPR